MVDNFMGKLPESLRGAILTKSRVSLDETNLVVCGYNFDSSHQVDYDKLLSTYSLTTGFQSTSFGLAIKEVEKMLECKTNSDLTEDQIEKQKSNPIQREPTGCTIFLGKCFAVFWKLLYS